MKRSQLAHILRAACAVANDPHILVIGSQSILGSIGEDGLPSAATASIEADIAFFDDPTEAKSDKVDGAIGEDSMFHETYGVYGQGVGLSTAHLPSGWQDRLVRFDDPEAAPSELTPSDVSPVPEDTPLQFRKSSQDPGRRDGLGHDSSSPPSGVVRPY